MRALAIAAAAVLVLAVAFVALAWRPAIAPVEAPAADRFDRALVERGAALAALGNCAACHTAPEGPAFAGGVPVVTPFGTIYGSNVTPDAETGIGRWSEAAFRRAMREGVARDGTHLYPAFPYDHFALLAEADVQALYAYLMTRDPVRARPPRNELAFPFGFRPLIAGWKLVFLDDAPFREEPGRDAAWNRGAYLVHGLAHCGACHTPRNALGARERGQALSGGEVEGWHAPALNDRSPSPLPWTAEQLAAYLTTGIADSHAIAAGPMVDVVHSLRDAPADDVSAIAAYVASTLAGSDSVRAARAEAARQLAARRPLALPPEVRGDATLALGASLYAQACASCHEAGRTDSSAGALPLPLAIAVHNPDPSNLIRIVRDGIAPAEGERGRWMPAFGAAFTDEQLAALAAFLRRAAANAPPWDELPKAVREARRP